MAVIRKSELREMAEPELKEKLNEFRQELMSQNAKLSSGGIPDNPGKLGEIKKTIARIYTLAGEKGYKI